ncbi:MAG: type IX secretion system membrane protein PorP/SprF [Chlorobi bacterium]|nr:type IX secretion system membrane protein PorP/SprF [Chlorobiota bacterium]
MSLKINNKYRKFKRLFIILSISILHFSNSYAQNYKFPDPYSEKIIFNPAYSGLSKYTEINAVFRKGFIYDMYSISYNNYFDKYKSGIGFYAQNTELGKGAVNNLNISGIYNYKLKPNYKSIINTAVQISYIQQSINPDKLTFSNQIDPLTGTVSSNNTEIFQTSTKTYDFSAGSTFLSSGYRTGFSIHHIDKIFSDKNQTILTPELTIYFGKIFTLNLYDGKQKTSITPEIIYQTQNNFHQIIYSVHGIYNIFLTRFFLKHNLNFNTFEAVFTFGFNYKKLRVSYTYQTTFTKYSSLPTDSNLIALRLNIGKGKKIKVKNTIYCLNF